MNVEIRFDKENLPWEAICAIFPLAPLGTREPGALKRASQNSYLVCTVWDKERVVGFARVISDEVYQAAIYDLVLLPDYQGAGVGKKMMEAMLEKLSGLRTIILYAVPSKTGFYEKFGFEHLKTGMAIFSDREAAKGFGLID